VSSDGDAGGGGPRTVSVSIGLDDPDDLESLALLAARKLGVKELPQVSLLKRSVDARRGRVRLNYLLGIDYSPPAPEDFPKPRAVGSSPRVVIVGCGPAGMFCAYELARAGIASVIVERGKQVQPRRRDLKGLNKRGVVDPDSNYCFGEGGAGTYSDGKLYTRSHKRGDVRDVLGILVGHGAPQQILTDARPHIGSNRLPKVIQALRQHLIEVGVDFRFETRVVDLLLEGGRASGVRLRGGEELRGDAVVLATGHSARDVHAMLQRAGAALEPKGFALGVRIEHPQPLIDRIQYGKSAGHARLQAASYKLVQQVHDHGVFSFCMCPGGWIVPASTQEGELVVNGMSLSRRDSPYANSGLVVSLDPEEWRAAGHQGPLGGFAVQSAVERAAWEAGGGDLRAPAVRLTDFLEGRASVDLPGTSYLPGVRPADLSAVLGAAGVDVAPLLREALLSFGRRLSGYLTEEAILVGVETRTSSPVRIPRDRETLQHPGVELLFPCGEGAGYAGGIVSAALDGMRVARAVPR
jgi:uncharacterized FAD-dependent dehydrogenase